MIRDEMETMTDGWMDGWIVVGLYREVLEGFAAVVLKEGVWAFGLAWHFSFASLGVRFPICYQL